MAALGYDAIQIVKAALEKANSTDHDAIKDAMGTVKGVVAATADIDMDPEGTPYKPLVILRSKTEPRFWSTRFFHNMYVTALYLGCT